MGRKSPARVAMRPSAIFHALEGGPRASSILPSSDRDRPLRQVPRHQHLPLFHSCRDFHLSPLSVFVGAPTLILVRVVRARVHPTFRVDPDFRVVVPTAASFIARSRSGAFHGRSACPESLPDQKERATRTSKQITEDCSSFVFIFALKLVSSD